MIFDETFLDHVAHDLRGELSTMLTGVHYLLRVGRDLPAPTREMLERIGGAGDRLARLLEELDDAAWLLDKPKELISAPVHLKTLLDDVVRRSGKHVALRDARLLVELSEEADVECVVDAEMLARALVYIVDLFLMRAQQREVRVIVAADQAAIVLRVVDEGAVVSEAIAARMFDPFVEGELVPVTPQGRRKLRLGLGLAIARAIFGAHGGSVVVGSCASGFALDCTLPR